MGAGEDFCRRTGFSALGKGSVFARRALFRPGLTGLVMLAGLAGDTDAADAGDVGDVGLSVRCGLPRLWGLEWPC